MKKKSSSLPLVSTNGTADSFDFLMSLCALGLVLKAFEPPKEKGVAIYQLS
jgi:hypothetical protein